MDLSLSELQEFVMDREALRAASWGRKESDTTEWLNWTELMGYYKLVKYMKYMLLFPIWSMWKKCFLNICQGLFASQNFWEFPL